MREIITDWGVDRSHFLKIYETVRKSYGPGVTLHDNCLRLDNKFAKGNLDFFSLNDKIALLRMNITFAEVISFKRVLETEPLYYACLFSLKEGVDLHVFEGFNEQEMNSLGMSAKHGALYFSADVQTLFRIIPNEHTKIVILVFTRDALGAILPRTMDKESSGFVIGQSLKGYASINQEMVDKITDVFEYTCAKHIQPLYLLGAVYELLAVLFLQIEAERKLLMESTGVVEVARMIRIRNLLVSDFSHDCPLLEEMAKKAQMSATKFKTLFKKLFELPYYQYYQRHRLMAARQAIVLGKSVSEAAYEFSFNSISNFSVAFKKMFKISPSEIEAHPNDFDSAS